MSWLAFVALGMALGWVLNLVFTRLVRAKPVDGYRKILRKSIAAHPEAGAAAIEAALLDVERRARTIRNRLLFGLPAGIGMATGLAVALSLFGNARMATDEANQAALVFAAICLPTIVLAAWLSIRATRRWFEEALAAILRGAATN